MLRYHGVKGSGVNFKATLSIKIPNLISRKPYATLYSLERSETLVKRGLFGHLTRPSDIFNIFYWGNNRVNLHGDAAVAVVAKTMCRTYLRWKRQRANTVLWCSCFTLVVALRGTTMCLHSNMQNNNKRQHEMFAQKVPWKATVIVSSSAAAELLSPFFLIMKERKKRHLNFCCRITVSIFSNQTTNTSPSNTAQTGQARGQGTSERGP